MGTQRSRFDIDGLAGLAVARVFVFDRPTALHVDAAGPSHGYDGLGGNQSSGLSIQYIKKSVLVGLHQHMAEFPVDVEVSEDELLYRIEIPFFARGRLIVPGVLAGIRVQRNDRGEIEIVPLAGAARGAGPLNTVARSEIQQVELGIVGNGIPYRT